MNREEAYALGARLIANGFDVTIIGRAERQSPLTNQAEEWQVVAESAGFGFSREQINKLFDIADEFEVVVRQSPNRDGGFWFGRQR